jgi:phenylacetate-CoA ligase
LWSGAVYGSLSTRPRGGGDDELAGKIAATLQSLSNLKGEVDLTKPGSLANDGLVIEDKRPVD